jgi:Flp pilus assembly pilin Flp
MRVGLAELMNDLRDRLGQLLRDEEGPTAVEYVLMAAGVALVILVAVMFFGSAVSSSFQNAANTLQSGP